MRLVFLGTRGEIEARTPAHERHASLLVERAGARLMVDCGLDWRSRLAALEPSAVLVTHAHPDHAGGLRGGAPCPVYAPEEAIRALRTYGLASVRVVPPRTALAVAGIAVEAFPVLHSLRAPAVGYRLTADGASLFYVPDVVAIPERSDALAGVDLYVGDGASLRRPIVRRRDGVPIGHASIRDQLDWCAAEGVGRAIFTHCGSQLVRGDEGAVAAEVEKLGRERRIDACVARDGLEIVLP